MANKGKDRAPFNRTLSVTDAEREFYESKTIHINSPVSLCQIQNRTINQDMRTIIEFLPSSFVDLLFLDPPYNLNKTWGMESFRRLSTAGYAEWMQTWLKPLLRTLKPTASVYICGDWQSSPAIHQVAQEYFFVRNRITWEREKGRGAQKNWKNCSEDIWYCTMADDYTFNLDSVKLRRRVLAPYTTEDREPKDWERTETGNYRLTHPSNFWTDITVPFWSMPENTDHPTQKPEKLMAKLILASSNKGDLVLDPFLGSGTTSVVAKKLGRRFVGVESELSYCCVAEKRLELAQRDHSIQGYSGGVFWERNTGSEHRDTVKRSDFQHSLF